MTQKYFSHRISFSLGHWYLEFINQFSHLYPFVFLPFFLFIVKALMKGSIKNTHCPFGNYRKILKMHLEVTCCYNVSDTDILILYQNVIYFLWFMFLCWTMRSFSNCQMQFSPTELHVHSLNHVPLCMVGFDRHWIKSSQEWWLRSLKLRTLGSPLELMAISMYYTDWLLYLSTSASIRIITN